MTALRRTGHWAAMVLGPLLVVVTVLAGVTLWAVRSAPGTRTVLQALPWVRVTAPEGALLGDFAAQRLEVPLGPGKVLTLQDVRWEGLKLEWQEKLPWRFGLHLDSLHARLIDIALNGPPQAKKSTPPPQSIALPFAVHVEKIAIGELRAPGLQNPTLTQIQGRVSLGADNGRAHIADQLQASWGPVQFNGEVRIATQGTMAVMSQASIERNVPAEPPALHWQGSFKAEGPLAKLNVSTNFQTAAQSDMQSLQAQATVTPFVAPGLPHLQVQTQGFDLQALHPRAPHTALSGKILLDLNVQPNGAAPLLKASAALKNGAPASFEAQGLPVSALTLQAATDLQHPEKGVLQTLRVTLADAQGDAGTLEGTGSWAFPPLNQGAPSTLDATLQASLKDVRTRALHRTAPAMSISGPLNLQVKQLSLQPASQARATQRGGQVSMDADLRANDMGNTANDNNQIDTKIDAKLSLPPLGVAKTAMQWLAQLRGTAQADLQPNSRFAGVPLQGHIELAATSDRHPVQAKADLQAATTRLTLDGALDTQGSGADDRWTMHLSAPDLALLTPLLPKALAERAKPKGQLDAEAQTTGRWPALQTQGHLDLRQLHWDQIALAQTHAQWEISPQRLDAPLALRIAGADLQIGPEHLSSFTANAQGSLKKHTIDAQIDRAARLQLVADATAPASTTSASASSASPPPPPGCKP
jgi:translocation and assembly module TamB